MSTPTTQQTFLEFVKGKYLEEVGRKCELALTAKPDASPDECISILDEALRECSPPPSPNRRQTCIDAIPVPYKFTHKLQP
jgi:hypothetical protein